MTHTLTYALVESQQPTIPLSDVNFLGSGLHRPECIVTTSAGDIYASNWSGGVTRIDAEGHQSEILAAADPWLRPNGIALRRDGSFLLAHLGDDRGGVFALSPDGSLRPFLVEVDGAVLPPTNFVVEDMAGRTWVTVSTRHRPRSAGYRPDVADGFVVLVDHRGARVVADGLGYTNEAVVNPAGTHLYVNETFAKRLSRFALDARGIVRTRETVAEFGHGVFPDGLAFDETGGVWITSIISNRVIRVAPGGEQQLIIDDSDDDHLDEVERAFTAGGLERRHLDSAASEQLKNISSLAFGGRDRRTVYLGCLLGDRIATFRSPIAGARPAHWNPST